MPPDFRALFAAAPTPMLIVAPDAPRFTIVGVNQAYLAATMRTHDDLVGSALFEAMPDNPDDPGATGMGNLRASIEHAIAGRRADRMPLQKYDIPHPAGGFEERWWKPVNTPVMGAGDDVNAVIHQVTDVTHRVRAEAAMHRSEAALRALNEELEQRVTDRTRELMRAEEALRQSQKMEAVGQLTGGLAHDFAMGLKVLQSDARIDLLVTDVGLPGGMNGRQMADAARLVRPGLKVSFITGYAENSVLNDGRLEPGMAVLTKPFAVDAMAARIKEMIEIR